MRLILHYNLLPSGTGETNLAEAEALLEPYVAKFPNVSNTFIEHR